MKAVGQASAKQSGPAREGRGRVQIWGPNKEDEATSAGLLRRVATVAVTSTDVLVDSAMDDLQLTNFGPVSIRIFGAVLLMDFGREGIWMPLHRLSRFNVPSILF